MHRGTRKTTDQDGLAVWATVAAAVAAVVVVAGGAWAVTRAGDGSADPQAGPGTTPTVTVGSPTMSTSRTDSTGSTPWSKQCQQAARQATRAGLTVLAPTQLPPGWTLKGCTFHGGTAAAWHLDVTTGQGTLALDQQRGSVSSLVDSVLGHGAKQGHDIRADGTGTWQSWSGQQSLSGLSKSLPSTVVVLSGPVQVATLHDLANVLLTFETAPPGNNGG
jgi:hypothetical protein